MSALTAHIPGSKSATPAVASDGRISRWFLKPALAMCLMAILCLPSNAQLSSGQSNSRNPQPPQLSNPATIGPNSTFQARRIRELNVERQKEMVSDADRLLKLTAQLNAEVAHNHLSTLTPDQLHMLERIEKLARSVRDKMSNPVQGTIFEESFPPPMSPPGIP
jgi:hypothetical protein